MSLCCHSFYYGDDWHLFIQVLGDFVIMSILLGVLEPVFCFAYMVSIYEFSLNTNKLGLFLPIGININLKFNCIPLF